jgi:hypothetical protein
MHDLDRTQNLFESDNQEMEFEYDGQSEYEGEGEGAFDEVEEMELAAELLEVSDEYELEQFLGGLLKKARKAAGGLLKSGVGQQLGGLLKSAAKMALPVVGNAIAPGIGGVVASGIGSAFGLELEGLSPQDQEFEEARRFVRMAGDAVKAAAGAPPNATPQQAAQQAIIQAAQKHAPGLLRPANGNGNGHSQVGRRPRPGGGGSGGAAGRSSGRWVRQGNRIVLYGV